jgi:hypothetical protein
LGRSFATVSAAYDKIMGFFEFTHRFFDRLSIIGNKSPQQKPFQRCVARVFPGMLTICSVAQEYSEKKRLSKKFPSPRSMLCLCHTCYLWRADSQGISENNLVNFEVVKIMSTGKEDGASCRVATELPGAGHQPRRAFPA